MRSLSSRTYGLALALYMAGTLAFLQACGEDAPTSLDRNLNGAAKPSSGDPTVSSTDPTNAPQGTTLDVRVLGSNFDRGSKAELALDCESGCVMTGKVTTNSTRFVSQGELVANITIAADADTALYDVLVTTSKGKRGIGIELFAVRLGHPNPQTGYTKVVIDKLGGSSSCDGEGINDQIEVVGHCYFKNQGRRGFFWTVGGGPIDLGLGRALEVSDFGGPIVTGFVGDLENPIAAVWDLGSGTSSEALPQFPTDGCSRGMANGVNSLGDRVIGYSCRVVSGAMRSQPVFWDRDGSGWSLPQVLPMPAPYHSGQALDISPNGVITGLLSPFQDDAGGEYFAWFPPYLTAERIPPGAFTYILVWGINDDGNVAGTSTENPGWRSLLWRRNGIGWDAPLDIGNGEARGINNGGHVAGKGGNEAYSWTSSTGRVSLGLVNNVRGINESGDIVGRLKNNAIIWLAPR